MYKRVLLTTGYRVKPRFFGNDTRNGLQQKYLELT